MKLALAASIMAVLATPAAGQASGAQSVRTAYGARLHAPDADDDPTDRRVLRRLNTRVNNRLETRIERYRFIDVKSDRAGAAPPPAATKSGALARTNRTPSGRRTPDDR